MPLSFQCVVCKAAMPAGGPHAHPLDPCSLTVAATADRDRPGQVEQSFWCHYECVRRLVGDDRALAFGGDGDSVTDDGQTPA
jgi:hypothetical protein